MSIKFIKKNSGLLQKFSLKKLERSIRDALEHCEIGDEKLCERIAHETLEYLEGQDKETVEADAMRQAVIHVLKQDKHNRAAETYELISLHLKNLKINEVIKRSGMRQTFHPHKLFKSIKKSFADAGLKEKGKLAEGLTGEIIAELEKKYPGKAIPVSEIKKTTAQTIAKYGFPKVEKLYLLHKYL
ncbi:MAG TPA: ATP cone domain-containing protein [Candidatus Paceibacterota bacterium]